MLLAGSWAPAMQAPYLKGEAELKMFRVAAVEGREEGGRVCVCVQRSLSAHSSDRQPAPASPPTLTLTAATPGARARFPSGRQP